MIVIEIQLDGLIDEAKLIQLFNEKNISLLQLLDDLNVTKREAFFTSYQSRSEQYKEYLPNQVTQFLKLRG